MKQMKIALAAVLTVLMGATMTSCLSSDNESFLDFQDYVTLTEAAFTKAFICESYGYTVIPTNGETMFKDAYPERAILAFKFPEGDEGFKEGQTSYRAAVVAGSEIHVQDFYRNEADSIDKEESVKFSSIGKDNNGSADYGMWTTKGYRGYDYLNIFFEAGTTNKTLAEFFNLYPVSADGNTLYMNLHHKEEIESYSEYKRWFVNFKLPTAYELREELGEDEYKKLNFIGSTNDSINLVVQAPGTSGTKPLETKKVKIKVYGAHN